MLAIFSLLLIISLSIVVTRVATVALVHTGMSWEASRFQARSAFTGSGFTTSESEAVVKHPVRRKIVGTLMLLGNAGVVTAISSLVLTFVSDGDEIDLAIRVLLLFAGIALLWALSRSTFLDRLLTRVIEAALRRFSKLGVADYASVLHLGGEYKLVEFIVQPEDWVNGKTLRNAQLREEGLLVLAVRRPDGTFLGAPIGATEIREGDELLIYGRGSSVESLDDRRRDVRGLEEHKKAVAEQERIEAEELEKDRGHEA